MAVGIVTEYAPPAARRFMAMASDLVIVLFALIMTWKGAEITGEAFTGNWTSESIYEFPLWVPFLSMPVGFGLLALQALALMGKTIQGQGVDAPRTH